jgi:tubulin polyglutamylase TTLL6/13
MASSTKVVVKDKGKKKVRVQFWSAECKYSVIIDRVNEHDWKSVDDEKQQGKVNIFWIDVATIHEHFRSIQPWQCINHFPGMPNIARKNKMGQNLNKMLKAYPKEYSFYPRTWILPGEIADFRNQFDSNGNSIGNKIYIIKPDAGCQGRGIYLTKTWEKVPLNENVVAQLYIKKPLLIDGYKFDLRIYVFVTSVKPLRVYLFHDGLVRMCTESYVKPTSKNLDQSCMHLTNYAVNKHNENFQQPGDDEGDSGHKRSLQWFMDWIRAEHGDAKANWVWKRMGVIIMRTLLSIMPILSREYDQHFKSFTGVPVDIRKIAGAGVGYTASQPPSSSGAGASGSEGASRAGRLQSRSNSIKGERAQSKEREQDTDEENTSQSGKDERKDGAGEQQNESEGEAEEASTGPKMRGSRCFEVLGYDIMLDSNLNPWVIEVNHLPRYVLVFSV